VVSPSLTARGFCQRNFLLQTIAGADIKELQLLDFAKAYAINFLQPLNRGVGAVRKPVIAAVNGFAVRVQ
jgi:enoyl-CoA hydratase/carnithine racemase